MSSLPLHADLRSKAKYDARNADMRPMPRPRHLGALDSQEDQ